MIAETWIPKLDIKHYMKNGLTEEQAVGRLFLREYSDFVWKNHTEALMIDESPPLKEIRDELECARISDIWYKDKFVYIQLNRPGILIGVKGSNIDKIDKVFKDWANRVNIPYKGIKLKEDMYPLSDDLMNCLISFSYSMDPDF